MADELRWHPGQFNAPPAVVSFNGRQGDVVLIQSDVDPFLPSGAGTIEATTNLIQGDGAGAGVDSGIDPANVVQKQTGFATPAGIDDIVACLRAAGLCISFIVFLSLFLSVFSANATTFGQVDRATDVSTLWVPPARTVNGHALSANVSVTASDLSLVIGTNVQAWDADLDTWATLTPSANAQTLVGHTFAQMRTDLGLVIGTNVEAWDTQLDSLAGLSYTGNSLKVVRVNSGETGFEVATFSGGGDALTSNPLSQFAATTSSQFKGVISDENAPDGASSKVIMALGSLSIASGKTGTFSNTLTLAGTDSSTLDVGAGGTLGSAAFTSASVYGVVASPLSQFAATTSSQFKGVISDENAPDGASSKVIMALGSLSIASGKTGTFSNTLTLAGTDSSTLNVGAGGTLGTAAFTAATAYQITPSEQTIGDASGTWSSAKTVLRTTAAMTANRAITLPAANAFVAASRIMFADKVTDAASAFIRTFNAAGTDTVNGGASYAPFAGPGTIELETDGSSAWLPVHDSVSISTLRDGIDPSKQGQFDLSSITTGQTRTMTWPDVNWSPQLFLTPTAVKTANYTAVPQDFIPVDTTSGNVTITLPTAPRNGTTIGIKQVTRGGTNTVTYACGGSDVLNKASGSTSGTLTLAAQTVILQYKSSGAIWYITDSDLPYGSLLANAQTWSAVQTFVAPVLGAATATSINKWTFTAPTTAATLTAGGDSQTYTLPAATDTIVGRASTDTETNKTLTAPTFTAPTTGAPNFNVAAGTLKTTPADGDIEEDANCLYGTTDTGNRGYIPLKHIIYAGSTVTQANDNSAHAIFTTPTNGRLTLETGTYRFHGTLAWTSMSATSGNIKVDVLGAGTATTGSWLWQSIGQDITAASSATNQSGMWYVTSASGANIVAAQTGTACQVTIDGTFQVTVAGTIIPTQTLVTAAAAVLSVASYIEFWRPGSTSLTSVGQFD